MGLTKSERHNRMMTKIFDEARRLKPRHVAHNIQVTQEADHWRTSWSTITGDHSTPHNTEYGATSYAHMLEVEGSEL